MPRLRIQTPAIRKLFRRNLDIKHPLRIKLNRKNARYYMMTKSLNYLSKCLMCVFPRRFQTDLMRGAVFFTSLRQPFSLTADVWTREIICAGSFLCSLRNVPFRKFPARESQTFPPKRFDAVRCLSQRLLSFPLLTAFATCFTSQLYYNLAFFISLIRPEKNSHACQECSREC